MSERCCEGCGSKNHSWYAMLAYLSRPEENGRYLEKGEDPPVWVEEVDF